MSLKEPSFSVGIEEEYLLVDRQTRDLASDPPESFLERCQKVLAGQVSPEFLRSQVEVGTRVCKTLSEARDDLAHLRRTVAGVATEHGLGLMAASTHPFAKWHEQKHTPHDRYNSLARDMQAVARRLLICGMHVHVGIEDDESRIDLMNQFGYFLPHLLALSCSSPFWFGENTGLKCFRLTIFDGMPRNGLPEQFDSFSEYSRHVDLMVQAGVIEDATRIWWDVRPSARYPTIEMRITDVCTNLEDAICIAALTVCLLRMLYRLRRENKRWRIYRPMLLRENRWRAMRYSFDEGLVDFGKSEVVAYGALIAELIEIIQEDAEALECVPEVVHANTILQRGTSAHRQIAAYEEALDKGASVHEALQSVVDMLVAQTAPESQQQ